MRRGKYTIAEKVQAAYQDIGHDEGGILWWYDPNSEKLHEHVSKAGFEDFHTKLMHGKDDLWWRGRASKSKGGAVTAIPPVRLYSRGVDELPEHLFNELYDRYKPKFMLVETATEGLKRVAIRKKGVRK